MHPILRATAAAVALACRASHSALEKRSGCREMAGPATRLAVAARRPRAHGICNEQLAAILHRARASATSRAAKRSLFGYIQASERSDPSPNGPPSHVAGSRRPAQDGFEGVRARVRSRPRHEASTCTPAPPTCLRMRLECRHWGTLSYTASTVSSRSISGGSSQ
jgi:hypothetical protein